MNELQYREKLKGNMSISEMTISEMTEIFNYWLKNYSPNAITVSDVNMVILSDCQIKEPKTPRGIELLNYSIKRIKNDKG